MPRLSFKEKQQAFYTLGGGLYVFTSLQGFLDFETNSFFLISLGDLRRRHYSNAPDPLLPVYSGLNCID